MKLGPRSILGLIATLTAGAVVAIGAMLLWQSRDTTLYSDRFNEELFRQLKPGMELQEVYALLGQPLGFRPENSPERWCYGNAEILREGQRFIVEDFLSPPQCVLFDETGTVLGTTGAKMARISKGMSAKEVLRVLGQPDRRKPASVMTLHYTTPGGEGLFRGRIVAIDARNRISDVISYEFYD